jgi:hypothetical protein
MPSASLPVKPHGFCQVVRAVTVLLPYEPSAQVEASSPSAAGARSTASPAALPWSRRPSLPRARTCSPSSAGGTRGGRRIGAHPVAALVAGALDTVIGLAVVAVKLVAQH